MRCSPAPAAMWSGVIATAIGRATSPASASAALSRALRWPSAGSCSLRGLSPARHVREPAAGGGRRGCGGSICARCWFAAPTLCTST